MAKFFRKSKTPAESEATAPEVRDFDSHVEGIAALGEPVRRALYRFVAREGSPVSREQAANGVGVAWHVAKFHLDRLEEDGLLDVEFKRPPGRSGPGAGRPTKLYKRSARELAVSLPERRYDLAGRIMAAAITASQSSPVPLTDALRDSSAAVGRSLGEEALRRAGPGAGEEALVAAARAVLDDYGYEARDDEGGVILANCPFHALAQDYTGLVCGINLDLLRGMTEALGGGLVARLDPAPGRCCVTFSRP
jgi:predicted ArsR family transcriptional regulator